MNPDGQAPGGTRAQLSAETAGESLDVSGLAARRIESLSDGVFAIAMTLLVLDLRVPEVTGGSEVLLRALAAMWPKFAGFALGFVLLGTLWVNQDYQFHYIRRADRTLLWLNLVLLLLISALPFGVALLGHYWASPVATAVYGGFMLASGCCLYAHWAYATHHRRLVASSLHEAAIQALKDRILFGLVGYGIGFGFAFFWPLGSILIYVLMPIFYLLPGRIDRHIRPASR